MTATLQGNPAKPKLLILITKSNFGGAQRYVYDLARSLKDRYELVVACGGEGLMKKRLGEAGIRTISIPFLGRNINIFKDAALYFWLAALFYRERPAVLHVNSSKVGGVGSFVGRIMGIKNIVFTAHAWAFNENRSALAKGAIMFFHWFTVVLAHRTIAVSEAVRKQMAHLPFMAKKISVVHLGLESFEPLPRTLARVQLGIPADKFAIGTIAELHPVKGLEYALEAVETLPFDCSYTIIGSGDLKENREQKINAKTILKIRAKLAGFVPDAARYLTAFDVFLLPSLSEAFGYVLLEAGYSNVPVIATAVGGIPEIIEDTKSGILIHSKNAREIANSLTFLQGDASMREKLAKGLHDKVCGEFSLDRMVAATVAIYQKRG